MATYRAKIVVIGDELLSGKIADANTQVLAQWLDRQGFHLDQVILCGDSPQELRETLELAWKKCDLLITTGGLGPTPDDITKTILSQVFQGELKENSTSREMVIKNYARIDKEWSPKTNSYHIIPSTMEVIDNPQGLAPGLAKVEKSKLFMAAPGVPRELKAMLAGPFIGLLDRAFCDREKDQQVMTIRTFGVPEEKIFFELMPELWSELSREGKVSSLPQIVGVDIHLTFQGHEEDLINKKAQWQKRLKDSPLAPHIWAWQQISLEEFIIQEAIKKKVTLGAAESCTGGLVGHRLTNVSGSSAVFLGSLVTYANEAKENLLGVKSDTLKSYGAVSTQTAEEMAQGAQKALGCDIAVSLTGITGPGGGSEEKPVGLVCMGLVNAKGDITTKDFKFKGDRNYLKLRFSEMGLHLIRQAINNR
jgi:nicotinamide-nucleotide amidase